MKFAYDYLPALNPKAPLAIIAHGMMGSRADDDNLRLPDWRELAPTMAVLRYDARGHGESLSTVETDGPDDYVWEAQARDLVEVVRWAVSEYGHTEVVLVGSSMGVGSTLWAMTQDSNLPVRALVLTIPSTTGALRDPVRSVVSRWADTIEKSGVAAFIEIINGAPPTPILEEAEPGYRKITLPAIAAMHPKALIDMFRGAGRSNFPADEDLKLINCPTLILCRDRDAMHPVVMGEYLHKLLPNSELRMTNEGQALRQWPGVVLDWVRTLAA